MKLSFFEALGIADLEKIHSQMIAWIFSKNCNALLDRDKKNLINKLFGVSKINNIKRVYTEYADIDILIETENDLFIIENKIKSTQHSQQLKKYYEFIQKHFNNKNLNFIFLTLVFEKAKNNNWKNTTYEKFLNALKEIKINKNKTDGIIVNEYIKVIEKLVTVVNDFTTNHRDYFNVFEDASKKKYIKCDRLNTNDYNEKQKFILRNQLETILQITFFNKILEELKSEFGDIEESKVEETRGDALIQILIDNTFRLDKNKFETGLQIQNKTIKFNFAAVDYKNSKKEWLSEEVINKFKYLLENSNYVRLNMPKSKAYISLSKTLKKELWEYEFDELVNKYISEYKNAKLLSQKLEEVNMTSSNM